MNAYRFSCGALALCALLLLCAPVVASVYTWEDPEGSTHVTSEPPLRGARLLRVTGGDAAQQTAQVELYTTSWCPYCTRARAFFRSRGVSFVEYDIEKDAAAAARKRALGGRGGVPFAVVNGQRIHGYASEAYAKALRME